MAIGPEGWGSCEQDSTDCASTKVNPLVPHNGSPGRQAGSAFKPFVAAAALSEGMGTDTHYSTHQQEIPGCPLTSGEPWEPSNYSEQGQGTVDMVEGLRDSVNVYFAQLVAEVGPRDAAAMAERLGIDGLPDDPGCAIALGTPSVYGLDMAQAYATIATGGVRCAPVAVTRVVGPGGEVLLRNEPQCQRVIDPGLAGQLSSLLQRVVDSGTGVAADLARPVAGKTGTTQDYRDAWFVGFTRRLATAVWLGYEQPRPMEGVLGVANVSGGTVPAPLWGEYTRAVLGGTEPRPLPEGDLERWVPEPPEPVTTPSPSPGSEEPTGSATASEPADPEPTGEQTPDPEPTAEPTDESTDEPTGEPTDEPTNEPTDGPDGEPTAGAETSGSDG